MKPVYLSAEQIQTIAVDRVQKAGSRNDFYNKCLRYYHGDVVENPDRKVLNMDSKGRPLLRYLGDSGNYRHAWYTNMAAPIIDDYQALLGRVPRVRFDPPDPGEQGMAKAQKLNKYMASTYDLSDMDYQQAEAGFLLPALGDACFVLEVDFFDEEKPTEGGRIGISSLTPLYGYPSFMKGFKRFRLYDLIIAYQEEAEVLERDYGYNTKGDEYALLVTYLSPWQRSVLVEKEMLQTVKHDLGFCPAEWTHNKVVASGAGMWPASQYGNSELKNVMSLQDHQNWALSIASDALLYQTYPILHMKNPMAFSDDQIEIGAGSITASDESGDLQAVSTQASVDPAMKMVDTITHEIYTGAGTTSVRAEGDQRSSIQTGRSIHAAQGPQATRLDLHQSLLGFTIERVNEKTLKMQEKIPAIAKPFEIWGRVEGQVFREDFDPKVDIDGWHQNHVTWDAMVGVNSQQKLVMAMQGMAAKIGDDLWAREIAGIEDPLGMRQRVEHWMKEEARMQQEMQGQGAGMEPKPGVPNVTFPGQHPQPGQGQPQQMPFRPPQLAAPPPQGGVPQGVTLKRVESALEPVLPKLKGTVYVIGQMATEGQAMVPKVLISDYRDHEIVTTALRVLSPQIDVKAAPEDAMPQERLRVA